MHNASELIDLAEECFRQAEHQGSHAVGEALRRKGLRHLEEAYGIWRKPAACVLPHDVGRLTDERNQPRA